MFGIGRQQVPPLAVEAPPPPPPTTFRRDSVASMRADLASQLEDILDCVWREERWAQVEDRLDRIVRIA